MDPTIAGALIGVGGTIVGAVLGYGFTEIGQRRTNRTAAATELAGLRHYLYHPTDQVALGIQLDLLAVSLAGCRIGATVVTALRKSATDCNKSSRDFARANPTAAPAVDKDLLDAYTTLVVALSQRVQRGWRPTVGATALDRAVQSIG